MKCSICFINGIVPESLTKNANAERSVAREFGGRWEENGILSIFVMQQVIGNRENGS